jgi:hypothetical protein
MDTPWLATIKPWIQFINSLVHIEKLQYFGTQNNKEI